MGEIMDFTRFNRYKVNLGKNVPANSKNGVISGEDKHAKISGLVTTVDICNIESNPDQARSFIETESFLSLKQSIKREGLLHPIILYKDKINGKYTVKAGHRRLRAVSELGYNKVDCIVFTNKIEATFAAISTNEFAESIHPIDKGIEVESLIKEFRENNVSVSLSEIADFYGVAIPTIKEWKQYAKIEKSVRAEITKRDIRSKNFLRKATKLCKKFEEMNISELEKSDKLNLEILKLINEIETPEKVSSTELCLSLEEGPNIRNFLYYDKKRDEFLVRDVIEKLSRKDKTRLKKKVIELLERL